MLRKAEAFFEALQDAGDADLDELVEVAGGDGEELDALEQGIGGVVGFFEDAAVELQPALVAIDETAARTVPPRTWRSDAVRCGMEVFVGAVCFRTAIASYETKSGLRGRM